jgi:DNA-binding HxlR family transcriptional regulator
VSRNPWRGYGRFCPLARALDVVGERWTLVIIQELQKRSLRYGELNRRLPGIGTSVLADRLRKLEAAGVVQRRAGVVGEGVGYELTDRGRSLEPVLRAAREWGAQFLFDPTADGGEEQRFDLRYVEGAERIPDGDFQVTVDGKPTALAFSDGELRQRAGSAARPEIAIDTDAAFLARWASGAVDWDDGVAGEEVRVDGPSGSWLHWLAATGYLTEYPPRDEAADDG